MQSDIEENARLVEKKSLIPKKGKLLFCAVVLGLIFLIGFFYYRSEWVQAEQERARELAAIGQLKVEQLLQWRKERSDDIVHLSGSAAVKQWVREWFRQPEAAATGELLLERLKLETDSRFYVQALFTDDEKHVLLSSPKDPDLGPASWEAIHKAWDSPVPVFGDLRHAASGGIYQDIAMALLDDSGRSLLVVVFTVDIKESLFPIMQTWPAASQTAETILVTRDGEEVLYLNELRHQTNTALTLRFPVSKGEMPSVQAVLGKTGDFVGRSYRGKEVIADLRPVPGTPWYLINQEELSETLGEVQRHVLWVFGVGVLLLLGALGLMGLLSRMARLEIRKRAGEEMEGLCQQNKLILDSAEEGILGLNLDGKHTFVNPSAAKMLGYNVEELLGAPSHSLWHHTRIDGTSYPKEKCQIYAAYHDGTVHGSTEEVFWRKNGTSFPVEYKSTPIYDAGQLAGAVVTFSDITERKRLEKELAQTKEVQFRTLLSILPAKVFLKNKHSVYLSCNENYANDLGIKTEDIAGKTDRDFFPEALAEKRMADDKRVMDSGKTESREEEYSVLKGSKTSYIQSVKAPILDKSGHATGLFGLFWDITEQRMLGVEKDRVKALASVAETKTKFASTVSHELRSPIAVIIAALDIALDGLTGEVNGELKEILSVAKRNSERLIFLVGNVLDFQKMESGKMHYDLQKNDLKKAVLEIQTNLEVLSKKKGLELKTEFGEDLPEVRFDRGKVIQVLSNLVNNAIRHAHTGSILITARKEEGAIHVQVRDGGSGISPQDIPKLFQPFEQVGDHKNREKGGTGLGLAISKEIILAHQGKIWAESELGKGTVFHFTLPL
ncbi:MAG: ATP-binding protein [Candidatus Omnitrophota bacterium]